MKANELMIGDWVDYRGIRNQVARADLDIHHDKWIAETTPIPLTPEILEKNRWKKQPLPFTSKKTCLGIWRDSKSDTTIKQFFIDSDSSIFVLIGGYSKVGNIKYVHQLQHILRDLGIEKEIELR